MCDGMSGFENLSALLMRLCMSWRNWKWIMYAGQSSVASMVACFSSMASLNSVFTSSIMMLRSVCSNFLSAVFTREKASKSSMSYCILRAVDCIRWK